MKNHVRRSAPGKGNGGEWLAAAALKQFAPEWCGPCFVAFMESNGPWDLHCVSSIDRDFRFRVEVKTTEVLRGGRFPTRKHDRTYGEGRIVQEGFQIYDERDTDIIALAALDLFCVNFAPVGELTKQNTSVDASQFTLEIMRHSLARSLEITRERHSARAPLAPLAVSEQARLVL